MAQRDTNLDVNLGASMVDSGFRDTHSDENKKNTLCSFLKEENFIAICHALHSGDNDIATGAALLLGRLKDIRALPFLLEAFLTTIAKKGQAIAWALGEIGAKDALPFLYEAIKAGFVKKSALLAVGKIGAVSALPVLVDALKGRDENQRAIAVKAMGHLHYETHPEHKSRALKTLLGHLEREPSRSVRLAICVVAARLEKF